LQPRQQKLELLRLLEEKKRRVSESPLKYQNCYLPLRHEKQILFHEASQPIRSFFGGNRAGKTEAGGMETAWYATQEHPFRNVPARSEIWIGCPSFELQPEGTQAKLRRYLPSNSIDKIERLRGEIWKTVYLKSGIKISFKSYEQGREKWQSAGKRLIWFDEEPPKSIWDEAFVRQEAGMQLDIILTMTPVNGKTWVYDDIYQKTDNPDIFVVTAEWDDNPYLTQTQKDQMTRGLTEEALIVRRSGKFVAKTGLVCAWWDRDKNLGTTTFNKNWAIGGAIDFGFSNPLSFGLIGVDYDDNINIFDGIYQMGLTTPQLSKELVKIGDRYGINIKEIEIVADSAQANDIQQLQDEGFNVIGVNKESGSSSENWDEYRARKMAEYGKKLTVSNLLTWENPKTKITEHWLMKEAESLKWEEKKNSGGESIQGAKWQSGTPNHGIDMYSYWLKRHLEAPERQQADKPWENKIKGTYIRPSSAIEEQRNQDEWTKDTGIGWS
jgi:phage terminase large subunit-like protein